MVVPLQKWKFDNISGKELERIEKVVTRVYNRESGEVEYEVTEFSLIGDTTHAKWQEVTVDKENDVNVGFFASLRALLSL